MSLASLSMYHSALMYGHLDVRMKHWSGRSTHGRPASGIGEAGRHQGIRQTICLRAVVVDEVWQGAEGPACILHLDRAVLVGLNEEVVDLPIFLQ